MHCSEHELLSCVLVKETIAMAEPVTLESVAIGFATARLCNDSIQNQFALEICLVSPDTLILLSSECSYSLWIVFPSRFQ